MPRRFSGALLRQRRHAAKIPPAHLAVALDKSVSAINQYEAERSRPNADTLALLADILGCSTEDFYEQAPTGSCMGQTPTQDQTAGVRDELGAAA